MMRIKNLSELYWKTKLLVSQSCVKSVQNDFKIYTYRNRFIHWQLSVYAMSVEGNIEITPDVIMVMAL